MSELEPAEEPESPRPCAPREESAPKPRAPRAKKEPVESPAPKPRAKKEPGSAPKPRVKKEPVEPATQEPVDPMFFAGLNDTVKKMVQAERRHRVSSLKFV